jgi:diguanylate cyclase (GGDEF)-like protein/PAS domain S-box-containing protein
VGGRLCRAKGARPGVDRGRSGGHTFECTDIPGAAEGLQMAQSPDPVQTELPEAVDERVLRAMVERSTVSFWILDENERIRYVNPAGAALTGYTVDQLLGQPFSMLMDEEHAAMHADRVRAYARSGVPSTILGQVREFRIRHKSGEMVDIELKAFPLESTEQGRTLFGGIITDNRDRKSLEARLRARATHDPLTGCLNRGGFFPLARRAVDYARVHRRPLGLLLMDVDHFKRVNDQFGHQAGDEALQHLVTSIAQVLRNDDLLGRYGGEEFVVLLPDTEPERVVEVAERVRRHVVDHPVSFHDVELPITISVGCATLQAEDSLDSLLTRADGRLYRAKQAGRNCVVDGGERPVFRSA